MTLREETPRVLVHGILALVALIVIVAWLLPGPSVGRTEAMIATAILGWVIYCRRDECQRIVRSWRRFR